MTFEKFEPRYHLIKGVASLSANANVPMLQLNNEIITKTKLKEGDRFDLLFDKDTQRIALKANPLGYKLSKTNSKSVKPNLMIRVKSFCKHFGLTERIIFNDYEIDDEGMIVLM